VYSKVLQPTVMRLAHNTKALGKLEEQGYPVGEFRWKSPREFRSFTYNQPGLEKRGGQTVLSLSKLADIPIEPHRPLPEDAKKSHAGKQTETQTQSSDYV